MIIVPSRFIMSFLLGSHHSHKDLYRLTWKLREHIKKDDATNLRGILLQVCRSSLSLKYRSDKERDLYLGPVAVNAVFLRDASLFSKVVRQITGRFQKDYYRALGELICLQDFDQENE